MNSFARERLKAPAIFRRLLLPFGAGLLLLLDLADLVRSGRTVSSSFLTAGRGGSDLPWWTPILVSSLLVLVAYLYHRAHRPASPPDDSGILPEDTRPPDQPAPVPGPPHHLFHGLPALLRRSRDCLSRKFFDSARRPLVRTP